MIRSGCIVKHKKYSQSMGIMSYTYNSSILDIMVRYLFDDRIDLKHGCIHYSSTVRFESEWELVV